MIVFNSLLKQGLLSIDESTLAFENGKLTAKISMGGYTEVETLPSIAEAKEGVTYLVPTEDYYTMYAVDKTNAKWITLGTTANKTYEFGDGLVESGGVVTLDEKPKAIRDYFINVNQWGALVPYLAIQDSLVAQGDISSDSALKGETLEIGSTIGADSTGLYDTRTTYPDDGKYVVTKYLLEERIKDLTLSVPTNLSQLNNDVGFATQSWTSSQITSSRNQCVLKSGSTMSGALTINNDLTALPLGFTTSMGVPAYGLQVSSTYGLQLFGTHFLNGTLWGDDGLKIVNNNLSLNSLDEAFISSDYANTTTFRAMPNDGTQATYKFEGWGWDDDSHTTKSPRLGVRLLKPSQATTLESTSVLNMSEGDARWVSLSGGTMTGYLNIPSPTSSSHPTTKSYVDNLIGSGGGLQNLSTGSNSLSVLGNATTSSNSVTLGKSANASGSGSTSVGYKATASNSSATALGSSTKASGSYSTALGYYAQSSGSHSSALGDYAKASNSYTISVGYYAEASASYSTALGRKATASENGVTVISAWNDSGNAKTQLKIIGKGSTTSTNKLGGKSGIEYEEYDTSGNISTSGAISFEDLVSGGGGGLANLSTGTNSLSIMGEDTTSNFSVCVGVSSTASLESTGVGCFAVASGDRSTAFGFYAGARSPYSTALGYKSSANEDGSIAIGSNSISSFEGAISIGSNTSSKGGWSIALGSKATAGASYSTAIGYEATTTDKGVTTLSAWNDSGNAKTQLKIIGAGSTVSTTKLGGSSGIEYEEYDSSGNITNSGAISFEDLVSGGGGTITVDTALSTSSTNPVQNKVVTTAINGKQATLVSGTNIKTINGQSILGSGDITISGGGGGGLENWATGTGALTILGTATAKDYAINIGSGSSASFNYGVALGNRANASGNQAVALGYNSNARANGIAVGNSADANGGQAVALGYKSHARDHSIAVGNSAKANSQSAIAIGYNSTTSGSSATAIGSASTASCEYATALGYFSTASGEYATALGYTATASGSDSIALGDGAAANGGDSIAIGTYTQANDTDSLAVGYRAVASGSDSIALGSSSTASGEYATALGYTATASGSNSTALGGAQVSGDLSTAIGESVRVHDNEVASIGAYSITYALRTQLYVIAEGSPLSQQYLNGKAGLAYAVWGDSEIFPNGKVKEGKIIALKDLFVNGIDFVPTTEEQSSCCGCCGC